MNNKYEIGGHLIDASGGKRKIIKIDCDGWVYIEEDTGSIDGCGPFSPGDMRMIAYEPPARTLTIQEAIEAAKRGEELVHVREGSHAEWRADAQSLVWKKSGNAVTVHEYYLTGWRTVPKAAPLPVMTEQLKENLDSLDEAFKRYDSGRTPGTYDHDKEINLGIASRAVRDAYRAAKGSAK